MNHLHRVRMISPLLASVFCVVALGAPASLPARGAIGGIYTPMIDDSVKDESVKISPAGLKLIQTVVGQLVGDLSNADAAAQKRARDGLARELTKSDGKESGALFLDEYCNTLNSALMAGPMAQPNMKARLNAGLVVAKVAEVSPNFRLEPVVLRLMGKGDKQPDPVVLWGMRAGTRMLVNALSQGRATPVLAEIVPAVKAHPISAIAQEGYTALIIEPKGMEAVINKDVLPELLKLFALRVDQYRKGIPADPEMEPGMVVGYLTRLNVFGNPKVVNATQQAQIVQLISDMLTLALKQIGNAKGEQFEQLLIVFKSMASCVEVLADIKANADLKNDVQAAKQLAPSRETPQSVEQAVVPMIAALKKAFPTIAPPPP